MAEQELLARIAALETDNKRLRGSIEIAAQWLRGELRADTINEAIRSLNMALPSEAQIPEVAWGVASLGALQRAVRNLCQVVALPEAALFLTQRPNNEPPVGAKRQPTGGIRYGS